MKNGVLVVAGLLFAGCLNFSSAEKLYCLQHLDVCGTDDGPHAANAARYVARPSRAQVPAAAQDPRGTDAAGAEIRFVYEPQERVIGWLATVPPEWIVRLCAHDGTAEQGCFEMPGATGAIPVPSNLELPLRAGGFYVRVGTPSGVLRGYLAPEGGTLRIAELTPDAANDPWGSFTQVVVALRPDGSGGVTVLGDFNGSLELGNGPFGARNPLGTLTAQPQYEWSGGFAARSELIEGALHVRDPIRNASGQLVPPGALVLHAQPDGEGLEPPTSVGPLAAVTAVVSPSRDRVLWLVHKEPTTNELKRGEGPHGLERTLEPLNPGDADFPTGFTSAAFDRRRVYVEAFGQGGAHGRATLLAPGDRLYGAALTDGVAHGGGAQVVFAAGSSSDYAFDLWTAEPLAGTVEMRTDGEVFQFINGTSRFSAVGESDTLQQALDQQAVEVRFSGGAIYSGAPRRLR